MTEWNKIALMVSVLLSVSAALNGVSAQNLLQGRQQNASDMEFAAGSVAASVKDNSSLMDASSAAVGLETAVADLVHGENAGYGTTAEEKAGYGTVVLGADFEQGNLRKAQDAQTKYGIFFDADGAAEVGRFHLKGNFTFRQSFENDLKFASTFNPLRDMPYIIADSTGGDWRKQHYKMWADISTKLYKDRLSAGIAFDVEVGRGAKNIDPRPQASMSRIEVKPSLTFNTPGVLSVSAGFIYALYRETSNMILYDSSHPQKLYLLKGLGQYTYEIFSSTERERKYDGNTLGASLNFGHMAQWGSLNLYGEYRNGLEKVYDMEFSKPHDRGNYYTHDFSAGFIADCSMVGKSRVGVVASVTYAGFRHSGREFVQHFDSSPEVNAWITDSYLPGRYRCLEDHFQAKADIYLNDASLREDWVVTAGVQWNNRDEDYRVTDSRMYTNNFRLLYGLKKSFRFKSGVLEIDTDGMWSHRISAGLEFTPRETVDTTIEDGLIMFDYDVPSSWYFHSLSAGYCWNIRGGRTLSLSGSGFFRLSKKGLVSPDNEYEYCGAGGRFWRAGCNVGVAFGF